MIYERDSVSWNILRLAQKEKIIYFQENANKSQRREIRDICADLCNAVKRMEAIDLRQNTKSETIILSFARELMYHCEAVKSILEKGEQTSENRTIQKKADIEKNLQIVRNTTYPAAFYLDKIKVDKMYGKPIREKYCRYIRIVAVAIVEYAHIRLEENGIEATLQNSIKEAYRILGHYVDSIWNDYFSFFDEKQQEEYQKPKLSTEMVRAIYCIFLCGDTIYDVPLNTGIIPQSLADERPSLENQKIETVTFRNSREAKIAVMNWEPHATGQLNVRLMINHSGVKVDRGTRNKKWMEFMPSIFSADATLDEIFDTYFDDSKWDNYKEDGKKIVTYTGDRVVESGRTLRFTFYFVLNSDDTFNLDHVTSNGTELDWLQEMIILNMLNEYYLGMNKTTSTSVATRVESEVAVSDNTVWNDSENSTSDYTEEDSDDEYAYISGADKVIDEVCGTVWDGWENDDPDHPELDEITYGMVMDYLFEDSTYYSWYYDDTTGNVIMEGTYTTFDYTMGMADEPTACDVKLTFTVDNDGNWFVSDYSGDEFDTADEFLQVAYDFYYEGNRLL